MADPKSFTKRNSAGGTLDFEPTNFSYLAPPPDFERTHIDQEPGLAKLKRKFGENPFIPFGFSVTTFALTYGIYQGLWKGNSDMSQQMMRLRVGAQFSVVLAFCGGVLYNKKPSQIIKDEAEPEPKSEG